MSEPLRVGVIGLGFFGGRHARIYADHPAAELIGVADLDPARDAELAGVTGALGFADYHELLALPGLQAVSICLPDRLDEEAAIAAADAGKAILLEHCCEAYDAIPVLDALAESALSGQPVAVQR